MGAGDGTMGDGWEGGGGKPLVVSLTNDLPPVPPCCHSSYQFMSLVNEARWVDLGWVGYEVTLWWNERADCVGLPT